MPQSDIVGCWRRLHGLRCSRLIHLDAMGQAWNAWGVHRHSVPTLVIALAGCSLLDVADQRILPLSPGSVVLVGAWVHHVNRAPQPGGETLLLSRTGPYAEVELWRDEGVWYGDLPWKLVAAPFAALGAASTDEARRRAADRVLAALAGTMPVQRQLSAPLQAMCRFAWRMRSQRVTAADILAASGRCYAVAHELFVGRFGETPKRYLLRCRLDLASRLLLAGGRPGTVWREAGFASRADFTRRFRLAYGVAPRTWLRRRR